MANRVVFTGLGIELAVRQSEARETLHAILEIKTNGGDSDTIILAVEAVDPQIINCFREYRRRLPIYVRGELRMRGDQLIVFADTFDYAHSAATPHSGFKKFNPLPTAKFATR